MKRRRDSLLYFGWEELLSCDDELPVQCDDIDSLLLAAPQMFEQPVGEVGGSELKQLFLQASQTYEVQKGCFASEPCPPSRDLVHAQARRTCTPKPDARARPSKTHVHVYARTDRTRVVLYSGSVVSCPHGNFTFREISVRARDYRTRAGAM